MKSPFLNMSSEQLQAMQQGLDIVNKIMSDKTPELRGVVNSLLISSPVSELSKTINKINNPAWIKKMEAMQESIEGLRKSALTYFGNAEQLKQVQKRYRAFVLENQDSLKNLDGYSVSFLVDSRTISDEPTKKNQTQPPIEKENCQQLTWISLSNHGIIANDIFIYPAFNTKDGLVVNEKFIKYLIDNPNREISMEELINNEILPDNGHTSLTTYIEDMKFEKEFARMFFDVSKDTIKLVNPITPEIKKERGIGYISIASLLQGRAGSNSYKKYDSLENKVIELCRANINNKKATSGLQLSYLVASIIEKEYPDLLNNFVPYKNYKDHLNNDWTKPTFYGWCNKVYKNCKSSAL